MTPPKPAETYERALSSVLKTFEISQYILGITCDNANVNDKVLRLLEIETAWEARDGKDMVFTTYHGHVRCMAHIINIVVQDILRELKTEPIVEERLEGMECFELGNHYTVMLYKMQKLIVKVPWFSFFGIF